MMLCGLLGASCDPMTCVSLSVRQWTSQSTNCHVQATNQPSNTPSNQPTNLLTNHSGTQQSNKQSCRQTTIKHAPPVPMPGHPPCNPAIIPHTILPLALLPPPSLPSHRASPPKPLLPALHPVQPYPSHCSTTKTDTQHL